MGTNLPLKRAETVRHIFPTFSGSCKTEFVAVTRDTDFSSEVEAALNEAAERWRASPIPPLDIASLF